MYKLKQIPEDFIVEEINNFRFDKNQNGRYSYFELEKRDYSTQYALQILSDKFNIPLKRFGFAGNKDRKAVTRQTISVYYGNKNMENFSFGGIKLKYLGNGNKPISLGELECNKFTITIRNLNKKEINKINNKIKNSLRNFLSSDFLFPNYFGNQRFGMVNHLVGNAIVKKDFGEAVKLILQNDKSNQKILKNFLDYNRNNFVGALRLIPLKTRQLYVHSYQSLLFNKVLKKIFPTKTSELVICRERARDSHANHLARKSRKNFFSYYIPIIGFGFEIESIENGKIKKIIKTIIEEEKINPRDFIIPQMPELSSEGTFRKIFCKAKNFKIIEIKEDDLNKNKEKMKIEFILERGCYATVAIDYLLENCKNIVKDFL